ncbi:PhzF family phenazine biosynthesis protein [Rhodococcoides corynebacterioides]|uniref:PhzF family phenazine biosynthesis protein n=1 Tax=Rhodococcoides corynebacterioides TaxID=53972 RepID=A0ABS7P1T9_9NOCA|nr:PhzF family phenazine biosynthesis protein [Rhodococcus corynebacterioides]MBY6366358.1 PhzF family phenazine biosynthesis protein [Rhodococcus corynebacterioides]MBY6406731.1 PhzF family phenazine biosynthesis protein [Rhodococcus corynebacterioides]
MTIDVHVVRVFTDAEGRHGNPLGIVDAAAVPVSDRQELARRLNYSETVFVDVPSAPTESTAVRIHTPAAELPFAGHPTVGTAAWLDRRGTPVAALDVPAGPFAVRIDGDEVSVRARADWAPEFAIEQLPTVDDVLAVDPTRYTDGHHYLWAWVDQSAGRIRSRMFAPDMGIAEDEATGAAALRITAHLGRSLRIEQGRGSHLTTTLGEDGWIDLGGRVAAEESRSVPDRTSPSV